MPRLPRFFVAETPLHVIQRGNDRAPIFGGVADCALFRDCLARRSREHGVSIHAYVLMTNHVHLLATPQAATSLPRMMQAIGRVYVHHFNVSYCRTGTLWEGRYKAAIVDDEQYLLTCMRYIEMNPVRAHMVSNPGEYPWSSFMANACGGQDELVVPHRLYLSLGRSPPERRAAYRALFQKSIPDEVLCVIRDSTQNAWALGSGAFRDRIAELSRRAERLPMGRPRRCVGGSAKSRV